MSLTATPVLNERESGAVVALDNTLAHYYSEIGALLAEGRVDSPGFDPGSSLPVLDCRLRDFFAPTTMSWHQLAPLGDTRLSLLDLRHNPATRTTKTNASLLLVARAVAYIQRTDERITIVTPSSGNKATALRDAVLRAIETGLVRSDQLNIVSVVPWSARGKLFSSALHADADLGWRNPVLAVAGTRRDSVKSLVAEYAENTSVAAGNRLWFTMSLANYRIADASRSFFEDDFLPPGRRLHAHAVSSAFGLLGHAYGAQCRDRAPSPYFLVQHLDTPDMVLDLYRDSFSRAGLPDYRHDAQSGLQVQDQDPHFPYAADSLDEVLETTFYTHSPATSPTMTDSIRRHGGGGIVVSLHECLHRYPRIRALLADTAVNLPADPREVREWSLVMALTGVLNASERGLLAEYPEIVVHGSGSYSMHDYTPLPDSALTVISDERELAARVAAATSR